MSREAMKLALEALDIVKIHFTQNRHVNDAITALREALAEQPAQQEPVTIGEPVGWHSKQYGFVYMALQPHQFEVGSTLCLKNGTPAWRIESSCSMTALISMSSLPHGTVFYTSPPASKPLTDEELVDVASNCGMNGLNIHGYTFARAIEAAHGIKGDA